MKALLPILITLSHLGAAGLFLVGILDSSFLFLPFGNDLLILGLAARHPARLAWYAAAAAAGSVIGSLLVDALARKGGEEGLSKFLSPKRLEYVKKKAKTRAGWALGMAALMPPPFPFTPFVAAAAAFQYPRRRVMAVLFVTRMLRFGVIGVLAIFFGKRILRLAQEPIVQYTLIGLLIIFVIGSAFSIYSWVKRSRHRESLPQSESKITVKA